MIKELNSLMGQAMNPFRHYEFFISTVKHGNFAAAARELGVDASTVAKGVTRLESELGITLFHRNTRNVTLTSQGQNYLEKFEGIMQNLQELELSIKEGKTEATGLLRMTAPLTLGKKNVVAVMEKLTQKHPRLRFELRLSDEKVDLIQDNIDLALRVGDLQDSRLISRQIGHQQLVTCASPAYLKQHGTPLKPADLKNHKCVVFRVPSTGRTRPFQFLQSGKPVVLEVEGAILIDEGEALVEAAARDLGIIQVPDYMVQEKIRQKELKEILPAFRPALMPISLIYPHSKFVPPKVRVMVDELVREFKKLPSF